MPSLHLGTTALGPRVSKSRRSRRSKCQTYLECATNTDTTTQTRMKMEHLRLSNELFRRLQAGRRRNCCLLPAKKAKQLWLNAPLEPIRASACPNKLRPSVPEETFEGSRAKGETTDYSVKLWHMWQRPCVKKRSVTLSQTWQLNQSVCTVPIVIWMSATMMDLFTFVRLSSN